jgi:hypothetical protein
MRATESLIYLASSNIGRSELAIIRRVVTDSMEGRKPSAEQEAVDIDVETVRIKYRPQ